MNAATRWRLRWALLILSGLLTVGCLTAAVTGHPWWVLGAAVASMAALTGEALLAPHRTRRWSR